MLALISSHMRIPNAETIEALRQAQDGDGLVEYADLQDLMSSLTDPEVDSRFRESDDSPKDSTLVRTGPHTDLFD